MSAEGERVDVETVRYYLRIVAEEDSLAEALAALDRLAAALERAERERDYQLKSAQEILLRARGCEARAEKAERALGEMREALREIDELESDGGTYDVVWDGVRQWVPKFKVIARAALRPSEEASDES